METKHKTLAELLKLAQNALKFIDALPKDLVLPSMPGFNRDWADDVIHEAAELYASEENRKKDEPKPFGYVLGADFYAYDSTLISESEKQKSTIVYADEPKQLDQVSGDIEEAKIKSTVERSIKEYGLWDQIKECEYSYGHLYNALRSLYLEGQYDAIEQSQQPVSIQWLSDEEINQKYPSKKWPDDFNTGKRIAAKEIQTELRSMVNTVDPKEAMLYVFDNFSSGLSRSEVEKRIDDYLTSKTK